jgi:hypothetical protein
MTPEMKFAYHLECVIEEGLPVGFYWNGKEMIHLMSAATEEQREKAFLRACCKIPLLLADEREDFESLKPVEKLP